MPGEVPRVAEPGGGLGTPVLYVCENNHWQAFVHRLESMLVETVSARASAYGIEGATVDGSYRLRGYFEPDD